MPPEQAQQVQQIGDFVVFFVFVLLLTIAGLSAAWYKFQDWRLSFVTSSDDDNDEPESAHNTPIAQSTTTPAKPFATPQNDRKEVLRVAEDAKLEALAQIILESRRKAFQNGIVPETRAIGAILGVKPSSDKNSEYKRVKRILQAKIEMLQEPDDIEYTPLTPEQATTRRQLALEK